MMPIRLDTIRLTVSHICITILEEYMFVKGHGLIGIDTFFGEKGNVHME